QRVTGHWCASSINLPAKVPTPLGGTVSVVKVCVDIDYRVAGGEVAILAVRLTRGMNVASERTGEAWSASALCSESYLLAAVQDELSLRGSRLREAMLERQGQAGTGPQEAVAAALNAQASAARIKSLLAAAGGQVELSFGYTKPGGEPERRQVSAE